MLVLWEFYGVKLLADYENLRVNTDNKIRMDYAFTTVYDPSLLANVDEIKQTVKDVTEAVKDLTGNNGNNQQDNNTVSLDFTVPENPEITYNKEDGTLTIYDIDGNPHTVEVPKNENGTPVFPMTFTDKNGNTYKVEMNGEDNEKMSSKPIYASENSTTSNYNDSISPQILDLKKNIIIEELILAIKTKLKSNDFATEKKRLIEGVMSNIEYLRNNVIITTVREEITASGWYKDGYSFCYYTDNTEDMKSTIFHEYIHHINYLLKIFPYRYEDENKRIIYSIKDNCFAVREFTMDEIYTFFLIKNQMYYLKWSDDYAELNDNQKQEVLDFKNQNQNLQQATCQFDIYKPSNYYREEQAIHEICETLNTILYNMSAKKYLINQSSIESYKNLIEPAKKYESSHNLNEKGYEK